MTPPKDKGSARTKTYFLLNLIFVHFALIISTPLWLFSPELEYSLEVRFTAKCLFRFVPLFINTSVDNYNLRNETEQTVIGTINSKIYICCSIDLPPLLVFTSYIMSQNSRYFTGKRIWHYRKLVGIAYLGSVVSYGQYR